MNREELYKAVLNLFSHNFTAQYRNFGYAKDVVESFVLEVSKVSGFKPDELCIFTPPKKQEQDKKYTNNADIGVSIGEDVNDVMEELIRAGWTNKAIAEKLFVHVNTVSRRRAKLGLSKFSRKDHV